MRYEAEGSPRRGHPDRATDRLARGLGLFSIALGVAEVAAPRTLSRSVGLPDHQTTIRVYGAREIATGIALMTARDPMPWVWARVIGDAIDLATLATGLGDASPGRRRRAGAALGAVAAVTLVDVACATALARETTRPPRPLRDYRGRTGFPRAPERMRGAAREMAGVY